jgi:hypothetical protein
MPEKLVMVYFVILTGAERKEESLFSVNFRDASLRDAPRSLAFA